MLKGGGHSGYIEIDYRGREARCVGKCREREGGGGKLVELESRGRG